MSQGYYQELWRESQDFLKKTLAQDLRAKDGGPYKNVEAAKWIIGHLFMNYVQIINRLDQCYDQMIHPQKREVIGRLLDMSLGRALELKSDIVRIELDDYCFFDDILIELKLTHDDMELRVPQYFTRDREKINQQRRQLIKQVFEEAEREKFRADYLQNFSEEEREEAWKKYLEQEQLAKMEILKFEEQQRKLGLEPVHKNDSKFRKTGNIDDNLLEAILLIQRHERARQGRVLATYAAHLARQKQLKKAGVSFNIPESVAVRAAKIIQKHWRRHRRRIRDARRLLKKFQILGITEPIERDKEKFEKIERCARKRRIQQEKNQMEYDDAQVAIKERVTKLYTMQMEDDITDEIIGWFQWFFEKSGYLPDYPPKKPVIPTGEIMGIPKELDPGFAEKYFPQQRSNKSNLPFASKPNSLAIALAGISPIGGSALVVAGHWIGPAEFLICQRELEQRRKSGKLNQEKKAPLTKEQKEALKNKQKEEEQKRLLQEKTLGFQLKDSGFLVPLIKADRDYRTTWAELDESKNPEQRYIQEFVKSDKCAELSLEVRKIVDIMMALELELFKDALERDKNPKKKRKKKKKGKGKGKAKRKKKKKDLTEDRTLEDLFMELFRNGIIRELEEVRLKDYLGERSFGAFEMRQRNSEWPPSTGDIRELVLQLCILPLGSSRLHQLSPLIRSVCILGAENCGKEFLARIVCTETASVLFDLTPENVAGKYPGKSGLKMLKHLVEKMSRALQPSIILVDGAEKTFYKKVPKEEKEFEPKRLAGLIKKLVKGIKNPDQILLLGTSSRPWLAKRKQFLKTYEKIILMPEVDYGSYYRLWKGVLSTYKSVPPDFDVSCLAKCSYGFSVKAIIDTVKKVLNVERVSTSDFRPYSQMEFLDELLKVKLQDEKMKAKCLKFYQATDLPKRKAKRLSEMKQAKDKKKSKK